MGWSRTLPLIGCAMAAACARAPSALAPSGPAADRIATLWWIVLAVCSVLYLVFGGLAAYAVFHRRRATTAESEPTGVRWVVIGGVFVPAAIVTALFLLTLGTLRALATADDRARIVIDVAGELWWWSVRYPGAPGESDAITANEIHVPVGEPVELRLSSENVIHSFWVPELHGKLDLVPGKVNVLRVQADRPGVYRGQCAEFCGVQHAKMALLVVAQPRAEFDAWLARQRQPARPLGTAAGRTAFERRCGSCHTVRGTTATGTEGPDLTHIASRRTLASASLPNTRARLGGWIVHAQSLKPGSLMPDVPLEPRELEGILDYLMSLR